MSSLTRDEEDTDTVLGKSKHTHKSGKRHIKRTSITSSAQIMARDHKKRASIDAERK